MYVKRRQLSKRGSEEFRKVLKEIGVLGSTFTYRSVRNRGEELSDYFQEETTSDSSL